MKSVMCGYLLVGCLLLAPLIVDLGTENLALKLSLIDNTRNASSANETYRNGSASTSIKLVCKSP